MAFFDRESLKRIGVGVLAGVAVLSFVSIVAIAMIFGNNSCPECLPCNPVIKEVEVLSHNEKQIEKIHSASPLDNFTFAVFGDSQDDKKEFILLKKIIDEIDSGNYLFGLETGDMVSVGNKESYSAFYEVIKNVKTPLLMAVGNHDILEGGSQNFSDIFGKSYYSFEYGKSLFIVLDVSDDTRRSKDQLSWLENQLKRGFKHNFVFMHMPTFNPPGINHSLEGSSYAKKLEALFEKYKPSAVFSGHIHGFFDIERNGVNYVISGGAGGNLVGTDPEHFFNHFVKVTVEGDKITKEAIKVSR